jgi:hypothetical protein
MVRLIRWKSDGMGRGWGGHSLATGYPDDAYPNEASPDNAIPDDTSPGRPHPKAKTSSGWNGPRMKSPLGDGQSDPDFFQETDKMSPIFQGRFAHFKILLLTFLYTLFIKMYCIISTANFKHFYAPSSAPGHRVQNRLAQSRGGQSDRGWSRLAQSCLEPPGPESWDRSHQSRQRSQTFVF